MSYNSVGRPKFYIDAVMLARQLGHLDSFTHTNPHHQYNNRFFLNPVNTRNIEMGTEGTNVYGKHFTHTLFKNTANNLYGRRYLNSIDYFFILGHRLATDKFFIEVFTVSDIDTSIRSYLVQQSMDGENNGWFKFEGTVNQSIDVNRFSVLIRGIDGQGNIFATNSDGDLITSTPIGDYSAGWSYTMPQSPDLELTQTFSNESLKVQTTKGGATLINKGWNQPPKWGIYPQWKASPNDVAYPTRRSWNLKFSFISDEKLMPEFFNELDTANSNRGIFERFGEIPDNDPFYDELDDGVTDDTVNPRTTTSQSFRIKDDFLTKVYSGTNGFQLPFIFQPNENVEEYAICRVNQDSVVFTQVAHRVYDVSLNIIEVW